MKLRTKLTIITTAVVILAVLISTLLVITFTKQHSINEITILGASDFETFYLRLQEKRTNVYLDNSERSSYSYARYRFYNTLGRDEFILQQGDSFISNNTGIDAVKALAVYRTSELELINKSTLRHTVCNIFGQTYFIASAEIEMEQKVYTLSIVRDVTSTMDDLNALGNKCALAGAGVIIAAALLVFWIVRRSLMPVRRLELGAIEISDGNYASRIQIKGKDEIASLAERFNRMAQAINEKVNAMGETAERQQAFINALSHEMKTPVTSIMARAETLLLRDISEADAKRSLERIYNQCAWLEKLSGKLTVLMMLQGSIEVKHESVIDLFAAVEETLRDSLDQKGISLVMDCKTDTLPIDFDLMHAALVNLVDNARKASLSGAEISLRAYDGVIEVEDSGRGIPENEIARITQPFYMIDRSRSKKNGGSGLGLALTQRIVDAHGAMLSIISKTGHGTTVKITFSDVDK